MQAMKRPLPSQVYSASVAFIYIGMPRLKSVLCCALLSISDLERKRLQACSINESNRRRKRETWLPRRNLCLSAKMANATPGVACGRHMPAAAPGALRSAKKKMPGVTAGENGVAAKGRRQARCGRESCEISAHGRNGRLLIEGRIERRRKQS